MSEETPHYHGHRQRLRERLLESGAGSLSDYELLEFLLFGAIKRGDTKPLAKRLIARFGGLAGVLAAEPEDLKQVEGMGEASTALLKVVPETARRMAQSAVLEQPVISTWEQLLGYCRITLGHQAIERFHLLFLDRKNRLIADEAQQRGTVDQTAVYPREVVKRALELGASAVILVHNHPSGDTTPSRADIEMTREVREAAAKLGIALHDHIVISKSGQSSFRSLGLL